MFRNGRGNTGNYIGCCHYTYLPAGPLLPDPLPHGCKSSVRALSSSSQTSLSTYKTRLELQQAFQKAEYGVKCWQSRGGGSLSCMLIAGQYRGRGGSHLRCALDSKVPRVDRCLFYCCLDPAVALTGIVGCSPDAQNAEKFCGSPMESRAVGKYAKGSN